MSISPENGNGGNGDGRLMYPPQREKPEKALIAPPITTLCLENIWDSLEDAEYLYKLRQLNSKDGNKAIRSTEKLLIHNLSCFEQNPSIFMYSRYNIAKYIKNKKGAFAPFLSFKRIIVKYNLFVHVYRHSGLPI